MDFPRLLALMILMGAVTPALAAKKCHKGKQLCGTRCIAISKPCAAPAPAAAPAARGSSPSTSPGSTDPADAALKTAPGQALVQLARTLRQTMALDVEDKQRDALRQGLRGARPPLPICDAAQNQLVRACEPLIGGTVTLPCTLAVEEIAAFCKERTGKVMDRFR